MNLRRCLYVCCVLAVAGLMMGCQEEMVVKELPVIPVPEEVQYGEGVFRLDDNVVLEIPREEAVKPLAGLFASTVASVVSFPLKQETETRKKNYIRFVLDPDKTAYAEEGYCLTVDPAGIEVKSAYPAGLFYGMQTLVQLLEAPDFRRQVDKRWVLPVLQIRDKPAFSYRGVHLDVSRHFFPAAFVKKYLDLMALYKMNTFHWHLTDAGGWRIELKRYPELTRRGAWRMREDWRKWWNEGERTFAREGDAGAYGGYYTQEEIRDIVAYAAARHIRVIPEIEMPGHSEEVLAVYPELSCFGKTVRNGEFCAGNEQTFLFLENVLTEVMELFPSEYIHIGGDEAAKGTWKKCPKCRKRIREEQLKDVKELQSYFVKRVEKFLNAHGRKMIGWDEILEGGLAPEATVMSWRGEQGGIEAARSGHDVIMTPGGYCYFDSYQADPSTQPYAIGGFLPYLKVYGYHPVPEVLSPQEARHVLGAQANLWTEYISDTDHVEYMVFPRLLALSEVVWSPRAKKDTEDFKRRVNTHIRLLQQRGVNVFTLSDRVEMKEEVDTAGKRIKICFESEKYQPEIRYTLDGSEPTASSALYAEPFFIRDSAKIKAALFQEGRRSREVSTGRFDYHKAIGKKVTYRNKYSSAYPAGGMSTLTDGYRGGLTYGDGRWQGFLKDIDVTVDLGEVVPVNYVSAKFMQLTGPGVYMPHYVSVKVSEDGKNFKEVARVKNDIPSDKSDLFFKDFTASFQAQARYIQLQARKQAGFMFIDEIVVY